jgi:hypothetical protein
MRKLWRSGRSRLPVEGFAFDRPIVVLQSDDWGRVGIRDRDVWNELCGQGINLGERGYDCYSLETADDVHSVISLLQRHRDSIERPATLGMNFILANVDFEQVKLGDFREIRLRSLADGLPDGWHRPGLFEAYRGGIDAGVLSPALHGMTHFCRAAVERYLADPGKRGVLLRRVWSAGVPYIHWRMPWVGFEYWDAEQKQHAFLNSQIQQELIDSAVESFTEFFARAPRSACAPGYRANHATHKAWAARGIRVAQNGPEASPPHFDENGILQIYRSIDFEPAIKDNFSLPECLRIAEDCFERGIPAIVSVHSINFHSALKDFRSRTLALLDDFFTALRLRHSNLLYLRDDELYELVETGAVQSAAGTVRVRVTSRHYSSSAIAVGGGS